MPKKKSKTFEEVFWYVAKTELKEAEANFERYLKVVAHIHARLSNNPEILEILGLAAREEDSNQNLEDLR